MSSLIKPTVLLVLKFFVLRYANLDDLLFLPNCGSIVTSIFSIQAFHKELTPLQSDVTAVNQKGTILIEQCRPEDSDVITTQLEEVNSHWDDLCLHSAERQQTIEGALLQLGQFQLALEELLVWIKQTNATLDEQLVRNVQGDVTFIEVEKAKHKVLRANHKMNV